MRVTHEVTHDGADVRAKRWGPCHRAWLASAPRTTWGKTFASVSGVTS